MTTLSFPRNTVLFSCLIALIFCPSFAFSATYYVATNGNNAAAGTLQNPWRTIAHAASRTLAGDTVRVQAGTYAESVSETTDGTPSNPITYVADGEVVITGAFMLEGSDYVRLIGLTIDRNLSSVGSRDALVFMNVVGCEVWHCTLREYLRAGLMFQSTSGGTNSDRCLIIGNTFTGTYGSAGVDAESCHISLTGYDNLVAYNTLNRANEDYIPWTGSRNRIINNYGHSPNSASAAHVDFVQAGYRSWQPNLENSHTLIEGNFYVDSDVPSDHHHFSNISNSGPIEFNNLLSRRNIVHRTGGGTHGIFENWAKVYMVNETYSEAQRYGTLERNGIYTSSSVEDTRIYNCIFVELWGSGATTPRVFLAEGSGFRHESNLAWDLQSGPAAWTAPFSSETTRLVANPAFVNYGADDFHLQSSSPAIGAATPVTRVTSASGSGSTFNVLDAGFFRGDNTALSQYGGNLVMGDVITVGTNVVRINSISGNSITVAGSLSWTTNAPVYLGSDATPDIGAYPYLAGGYGIAIDITSHTNGQGVAGQTTVQASVGNPEAVRYVVFFVNGIPTAVDAQSPFTYSWDASALPQGSQHRIDARAYALYASTRPPEIDSVVVQVGTVAPPPPTPGAPDGLWVIPTP